MSEKYSPQKGDRVRVVYEGEVISASGEVGFSIQSGDEEVPILWTDKAVSVEKIKPLVEVFQPGDVVRWKNSTGGTLVVLGRKDYTELPSGAQGAYSNLKADWFSSERYEKVSLG